jgi:hypothetical protein
MSETQVVQIVAFMRLANQLHGNAKGARIEEMATRRQSLWTFSRRMPSGRMPAAIRFGFARRKTWRTYGEPTSLGASRTIFRVRSANPPSRRERRSVRWGPTPPECSRRQGASEGYSSLRRRHYVLVGLALSAHAISITSGRDESRFRGL